MQYKLAKDLLFAKAGEVYDFTLEKTYDGFHVFPNSKRGDINQKQLDKMISEGWITETKPREFEIKLGENSIGLYDITNKKWIFHPFPVEPTSSIKVKEIIA